jgi:aryl-alcohol dehydrogenase-like predicted oxidoreductase
LEVIEKGDVFQTLEDLKERDRIKFYGISIFEPEEGIAAMRMAPGLSSIMCPYNILEQEHGKEVFPMAKERGVAIIARSPLASGRLTGTLTEDTVFPEGDYRATLGRKWLLDAVKKADRLKFLIKGGTITLAQAALKFLLANDTVSVAIPGSKTMAELEGNVKVSEGSPLSKEDLDRIKDLYENNFYI